MAPQSDVHGGRLILQATASISYFYAPSYLTGRCLPLIWFLVWTGLSSHSLRILLYVAHDTYVLKDLLWTHYLYR